MLSKLGKWLISRFPEKVTVTQDKYDTLLARLFAMEETVIAPHEYQMLLQRVSTLEQNSVHKEAVKTIVLALKDVKDEFQTVKTGLGINNPRMAEIQAVLNGEPIGEPHE